MRPEFPRVLDSTMLASWRCPRKFQLAHIDKWGPRAGKSIHLIAGAAYAKGLEVARLAYCHGEHPEKALERGIIALTKEYGDADPGDSAKTLNRMVGALEFYFDRYPLATDTATIARIGGVPAVEWSFALPLPFNHPTTGDPLLYAGRADALMNYGTGLYGEDDKTTSQLGASWGNQWQLRSQFMGYGWAARELGTPLAGMIIRGVSILKTKYDTQQVLVNLQEWKIDRWVEHRNHIINQMLEAYYNGYFDTALDETCNEYGGCLFKHVCETPPQFQPNVLDTEYAENDWNPLFNLKEQA